ncbi:MAG: ATP-binding protein, partial [Bacteroidetes bacterium]|nr:ATP-binding protein [Bacteroidota bacterium]
MSRKSPKPREDFIPILKDWTHSCFYVKLHDAQQKDNELAPFLTAITDIVTQAKSISAQVVRYFPQYTDHGEIHLKNVLSYMSWMAEESITDWHPVECGIAILAAYVHDLGMVPTEDEKVFLEADDPDLTKLTPEHRRRALAWFRFRDEDPMWRRYQADKRRSDCRTLALANFLRNSHASVTYTEGKARIEEHLRVIAQVTQNGESFFSANGFPWLQGLVLLCLSHNADVKFIERSLSQCSYINLIKAHEQMLSRHGLHEIHWPRISWALRLADVIDMDASRTPSILLNTITEPESLIQWKKHYCIGKFKISESKRNQSQLIYFVGKCPDAETEHALREMVGYTDENQRIFSSGWINEELQNVLAAQDRYGAGRSPLRLPEIAYADISERKDNYEYEELVFKLQRESVMGLFMGEALYGSPDICLRELVQNALDAIHLRELFWKWHVGNLDLPTDSQNAIVPNVKTTQGEKLCVEVRWGEEEVHRGTEQKKMRFIEVRDTGVGMSLEALKRYLTQVGQSYYTSRTFAEQRYEMLHNHGLVCTPISQFGIGFLAIFMLTDHVEIITCTADQKWKIDIHGPHSFMKLTPLTTGGPKRTGTWVKIWVKDGIEFEPFNWASFIDRLRCYFYAADKGYSPADNTIEPAWAIARSVVWPLHPVVLFPPSSNGVPYRDGVPIDGVPLEMKDGISLDGDFHARYLLLSPELKPNVLRPWFDRESKPRTWNHRDWTDGPDSDQQNPLRIPTGSRVRVLLLSTEEAFQQAVGTSVPPVPTNLAEELIEALPFHPKRRSFVLINGLYLTNGHELLPWSNIEPGFGSIVWLDLRGDAALKLRADRKDIVQDQSKVREPAAHVQDLWFDWWKFDQDWKNIAIWCDGAQRRKADHAIE